MEVSVLEEYFPKMDGTCGSTIDVPAVFDNFVAWNSLRGGNDKNSLICKSL